MSQLTTNTTTIDECIALANSLPDAGSGGGSIEVESCIVSFDSYMFDTLYSLSPNTLTNETISTPNTRGSVEVVKNSIVCILCEDPMLYDVTGEAELLYTDRFTLSFIANGDCEIIEGEPA